MINVSEVITDPDFNQQFEVIRRNGQWVDGRYETTETSMEVDGVIVTSDNRTLDVTPEGNLHTGTIGIWTLYTLYVTQEGEGLSDVVVWMGDRYIIQDSRPHIQYGYNYYQAVREKAC